MSVWVQRSAKRLERSRDLGHRPVPADKPRSGKNSILPISVINKNLTILHDYCLTQILEQAVLQVFVIICAAVTLLAAFLMIEPQLRRTAWGGVLGAASLTSIFTLATAAAATELVYTPVNPTFGGNPLNGTFLFQSGQAQGHGAQGTSPNLSGLDNALNNLSVGTPIIINLPTTGTPTNP